MQEMKKTPQTSESRAGRISKEAISDLVRENPIRCLDDRKLADIDYKNLPEFVVRPDETRGPQMLGGAYSPFDIALETAPVKQEINFDLIFNITEGAFSRAGYVMGIHMSDLHGEMSEHEILKLMDDIKSGRKVVTPDCGADVLANDPKNPFGFNSRSVNFHRENPKRGAEFVRRGAKIAILGGHHASIESALAIINTKPGKTLDSNKAHEIGQPAYNHDQLPFQEILQALAVEAGEIDPMWGENIRVNGEGLYMKWHRIAVNKLAGMDPIRI